jgi:CRISPR-associated protein Cas6
MTVVDLSFPLAGNSIPRDHGYSLYAAVTTKIPALHDARWLGIHPIGGRVAEDVILLDRGSALLLRLPPEHIPAVLPLAGARLDIGKSHVRLGPPHVRQIPSSPALDSRLVLLKLTRPPTRHDAVLGRDVLDHDGVAERYRMELLRQLAAMRVNATLALCGRQCMTIKGKRLVGYSVRLTGLDADASVQIQQRGLGGRRALGCGIFRPTRGLQ